MAEVTFSVVIPSYRTSFEEIERALNSVIEQTIRPQEILIIDDNGDNEYRLCSQRVQEKFGTYVRVLYNEKNSGANYSRNKGIQEAKNDYIAFLDSDDIWCPTYIERCRFLIEQEGAMFITSSYYIVHKDGVLPWIFNEKTSPSGDISKRELYEDVVGPTSTVIVSKKILLTAGLFDQNMPARQDYDMWLRVSKLVALYYNYEPSVYVYRVGKDSISSSYERNMKGSMMVLEKILSDTNITTTEKQKITASHYRCMGVSCVVCNAYAPSRSYFKKSLQCKFDIRVLVYYILSLFPNIFSFIRKIRRKYLYVK